MGSCSHPWPDRLQGTGVGMGCTRLAGVDSSGQRDSQRERLYTRQPGDLCCPRLPLAARPRGWAQVSMPDRGQGSGLTSESFCQQRFKATTLETQSKLDVRRSAMDPPDQETQGPCPPLGTRHRVRHCGTLGQGH